MKGALALIVMGASAGAIEALMAILPALPKGFSAAVIIVVHMSPDDPGLLPSLFAERCRLPVKEADDKAPIESGVIYFAPVDYHTLVETGGSLALSRDTPENFSRPSIDVLFESVAASRFRPALAVVLSGANEDGAAGARAIESVGGRVFVQSPESAQCTAMPRAALELCPSARSIPLDQLAVEIVRWGAEASL